jgi:AraC family transcriptional regulator
MLLAGLRRRHNFAAIAETLPAQWAHFRAQGALQGRIGDEAYGAICGESASGFEYMCAVEVESFGLLPPDLGRMKVPAQNYAVFEHNGHVSGLAQRWVEILQWLGNSEYESSNTPDFERYDHRFDPTRGIGRVEIWIGINAKCSDA